MIIGRIIMFPYASVPPVIKDETPLANGKNWSWALLGTGEWSEEPETNCSQRNTRAHMKMYSPQEQEKKSEQANNELNCQQLCSLSSVSRNITMSVSPDILVRSKHSTGVSSNNHCSPQEWVSISQVFQYDRCELQQLVSIRYYNPDNVVREWNQKY